MKIPRDCNGADLARALRRLGYSVVCQEGSHIRLTTEQHGQHHITIPAHTPLKVGLLNSLLKDIAAHHGLSAEQLLQELEL